jgi:hypothetical protein
MVTCNLARPVRCLKILNAPPYLDSSRIARKLRTTAEVDCSRIFGPRGGHHVPWPRWKVARGEPIV